MDLVEKDYVLGWLLYGVASCSVSDRLAFKGGTALSKVYFPDRFRLSEDLDFTVLDEAGWEDIKKALAYEVPRIVSGASGIPVRLRDKPFTNPSYLQSRLQYAGPVSPNTVKIEASKEKFVGRAARRRVPSAFDYPPFKVRTYSLNDILAEKLRTLLERGKVKDYYDVWKLLSLTKFSAEDIRDLFMKKCRTREIRFNGVGQFFPKGLVESLRPFMKSGLARLSVEPLPDLEEMLQDMRERLEKLLG